MLRPFSNEGWPLYDLMREIIPSGVASGHHSFAASVAPPASVSAPTPTPASDAPTPAAQGAEEDTFMDGPTTMGPTNPGTSLASQSLSASSLLPSRFTCNDGNSITTDTSYMRPPPSNSSSKGKRRLIEITDSDPIAASNFMELPYAQTISSSTNTGPATKKRKGGAAADPASAMAMGDAMAIAATRSSSRRTRAKAPEMPQDPMLVTLVGAVSHLAGSIERTMQPAEERVSSKKQQAIRILEDEHEELTIDEHICLLHLIGENEYIADVLTLVQAAPFPSATSSTPIWLSSSITPPPPAEPSLRPGIGPSVGL